MTEIKTFENMTENVIFFEDLIEDHVNGKISYNKTVIKKEILIVPYLELVQTLTIEKKRCTAKIFLREGLNRIGKYSFLFLFFRFTTYFINDI